MAAASDRRRWAGLCVSGAVGLAAWLAWAEKPAERPPAATRPARIAYGPGRRIAALANRQINESSGLACGRVNPGVFWTHNDSGDAPRVFAFNAKGEHLATCNVVGAAARDWEDMCSFKLGGRGVLLIGDVGDNARARNHCALYAVREPVLQQRRKNARADLPVLETIRYRYADGARNCESIGFDPTTRTVLIVSKELTGACKVYALPWPKRPAARPVVIQPIATLKIPMTSAMDVSPDGRRAVVLTYGPAYEYTRGPKETWAAAFARGGRRLPMPRRRQGESICYGADGKTLYLTSEQLPAPLLEVPVAKPAPASRPARKE